MKNLMLSILFVQIAFGYSRLGVEDSPFKTMSETIMESNIIYIPIIMFVTLFMYHIYKWYFVYGISTTFENTANKFIEKTEISEHKSINKITEINELTELKKELNFIIKQNFKSIVLKERINNLISNFEKRYIENKNILNNLKINTNEKEIAINENIKIIEHIKEIIKTTKIKKEEINLIENTEEIKNYLNIWEKIGKQ